jgi:hypothetical protein
MAGTDTMKVISLCVFPIALFVVAFPLQTQGKARVSVNPSGSCRSMSVISPMQSGLRAVSNGCARARLHDLVMAESIAPTQPSAGPRARAANNKLKDSVSVKDFGAVCDATTDSSVAVQAAVNAARIAIFPADGCDNSYLLKATVTVPAGHTVMSEVDHGNGTSSLITTGANVTTFVAGGDNTSFINLNIAHTGASGNIIDLGQTAFATMRNSTFLGANATNKDGLIRTYGGAAQIEGNKFDNSRPNAPAIDLDRRSGRINIATVISRNFFGGSGQGVWIRSTDNSARPEGIHIQNNQFVNTNTNLYVEQVLWLDVVGNTFDQGGAHQIYFRPTNTGIDSVSIVGNWIATSATGRTTGTNIYDDNSNTGPGLVNLSIAGNSIEFAGTGIELKNNAANINILSNNFAAIKKTAISIDQSFKVNIVGNTCSFCARNYDLVDGVKGGPFNVGLNQWDEGGTFSTTMTSASKFIYAASLFAPVFSSPDSTGALRQITVNNSSTAPVATKFSNLSFKGTDTIGTSKEAGVIRAAPGDVNYVTADLAFLTRSGDVVSERLRLKGNGHIVSSGAAAVLSNCGSGASIDGTDTSGTITEGSGATGCTLTWAAAYSSAPRCVLSATSGQAFSYRKAAASIRITNIGSLAGTQIDYWCGQ